MSKYEQISKLISRIRNARFGEMVNHLEQLIDSGEWRDFTTPAGTHFRFRDCEFDYFLAAMEIDPTLVRWAYLKADDVEDLAKKQIRLADITGRGRAIHPAERRDDAEEVAREYDVDPSGAGARIREWKRANAVVTERTAKIAADPARRHAVEAGEKVPRTEPTQQRWDVRWHDERPAAEVIAARLLKDPDLAREVYNILERERVRTRRENKRRSEG